MSKVDFLFRMYINSIFMYYFFAYFLHEKTLIQTQNAISLLSF